MNNRDNFQHKRSLLPACTNLEAGWGGVGVGGVGGKFKLLKFT